MCNSQRQCNSRRLDHKNVEYYAITTLFVCDTRYFTVVVKLRCRFAIFVKFAKYHSFDFWIINNDTDCWLFVDRNICLRAISVVKYSLLCCWYVVWSVMDNNRFSHLLLWCKLIIIIAVVMTTTGRRLIGASEVSSVNQLTSEPTERRRFTQYSLN